MADGKFVIQSVAADGTVEVKTETEEPLDAVTLFMSLLESHGLTLDHTVMNTKLLIAYLSGEKHLEYYSMTHVISITIP